MEFASVVRRTIAVSNNAAAIVAVEVDFVRQTSGFHTGRLAMGKADLYYSEVETSDGRVAFFPYKPFGRGYVADERTRDRFWLAVSVWAIVVVAIAMYRHAPPWRFVVLATYPFLVSALLRGLPSVAPIGLRDWAERQAQETSKFTTVLALLGSLAFVVAGVWLIWQRRTSEAIFAGALSILFFGFGAYYFALMLRASAIRRSAE